MADLILDQLGVTLQGRALLHPTSIRISPGRFVAVVGANGAGKTTLLRAIAGLTPICGAAQYAGRTIGSLRPIERAQLLGYLPQAHDFAWAMPVRDMVALGLYAFGDRGTEGGVGAQVDMILSACGIADLADRPVDRLSGGERAVVALARVLIAQTPLLLLDEPVAALDIGRQYQLLEQLSGYCANGRTIITILHDLALVSQFADRILWVDGGKLVADTENSPDAINTHAPRLLGRAPQWAKPAGNGPATLFFKREETE